MNKKLFLLALLFIGNFVNAQQIEKSILKLTQKHNAKITSSKSYNVPEFIRFSSENAPQLRGSTLKEKAINFLKEYKTIYKIKDIEKTLRFHSEKMDNFGFKQVVFKQYHNGVAVFDGQLRFHFNNHDVLTAVNGNVIPQLKINTNPTISNITANAIAISAVEKQQINYSGDALFVFKSNLYVFNKGLIQGLDLGNQLVYEVEVRNDNDVREYVFVNAFDGSITEQYTGIAHAINRVLYEGSTINQIWIEGDAFPGTLDIWQRNEIEASGHMYNLFKNAFGYISYDNADAQMKTINNDPGINCPNANWNGTRAGYCTGTASDDIVAHEWGHAYMEYTSGLIYAYQSGAMNESFSDIWGETVDLINGYEDIGEDLSFRTGCNSSDRWRMGEDASAFGGAIRDMWDPTCNGDPGKVTDSQYKCSAGDSGGVHSNSGIPNHLYALLVDGGTYNGQTTASLGFTKAAHIFWRAQSVYLTPTSDFVNLADALEAACSDLTGVNLTGLSTASAATGPSGQIITAADCQQVTNAILAVELRTEPSFCNFTPILTTTAPLCGAASTNRLFFEDWETGLGSWTVSQLPTNAATWETRDWVIEPVLPDGRAGQGIFGIDPVNGDCSADLENGIIRLESPIITMPNITTGTFEMSFDHYVSTEANWDGGNIKYSLNGGAWTLLPGTAFTANAYNGAINGGTNDNPLAGEAAFTGSDEGSTSGSWGKSTVNLSSLGLAANGNIQLRWEMATDGCNGRIGWYLDEIVIYNCAVPLAVSEYETILEGLSMYPNPTKGIFTLRKTMALELLKAEVYDINGRLLKLVDLSNVNIEKEIDISNLNVGIYFVKITTQNAKGVYKLIKE